MTNFEKIKQMTMEEFADFFRNDVCSHIQYEHKEFCEAREFCEAYGGREMCVLEWLNQEVE